MSAHVISLLNSQSWTIENTALALQTFNLVVYDDTTDLPISIELVIRVGQFKPMLLCRDLVDSANDLIFGKLAIYSTIISTSEAIAQCNHLNTNVVETQTFYQDGFLPRSYFDTHFSHNVHRYNFNSFNNSIQATQIANSPVLRELLRQQNTIITDIDDVQTGPLIFHAFNNSTPF